MFLSKPLIAVAFLIGQAFGNVVTQSDVMAVSGAQVRDGSIKAGIKLARWHPRDFARGINNLSGCQPAPIGGGRRSMGYERALEKPPGAPEGLESPGRTLAFC